MAKTANYPSLEGRSVFVTGGSSGIGADIVVGFAPVLQQLGGGGRRLDHRALRGQIAAQNRQAALLHQRLA